MFRGYFTPDKIKVNGLFLWLRTFSMCWKGVTSLLSRDLCLAMGGWTQVLVGRLAEDHLFSTCFLVVFLRLFFTLRCSLNFLYKRTDRVPRPRSRSRHRSLKENPNKQRIGHLVTDGFYSVSTPGPNMVERDEISVMFSEFLFYFVLYNGPGSPLRLGRPVLGPGP